MGFDGGIALSRHTERPKEPKDGARNGLPTGDARLDDRDGLASEPGARNMNGPHDMGGMQCYGPVLPEPNEPLFHAPWERRAMAVTVAMGATGMWNIDMSGSRAKACRRRYIFRPAITKSGFAALEAMLAQRGIAVPGQVATGEPARPARVPDGEAMRAALARGGTDAARGNAPGTVRGGRYSARPQHQPAGTHAAAALCPREGRGRSRPSMAAMSLPMPMRPAGARTRNGSTRSGSPQPNCSARMRNWRISCSSIVSSLILKAEERPGRKFAQNPARLRRAGVSRSLGRRRLSR